MREKIRLVSSAGTGHFYTTTKNKRLHPEKVEIRSYNPNTKGHPRQIKRAVELLLSAKRPMIYTGGGIILDDASAEVRQFVRKLGYPITQTLMGLGAFPGTDPHFIGMLGRIYRAVYLSDVTIRIYDE